MEPEAKYVFVGSMMVVLSLLAVVALLWLSEAGGGRSERIYTVYFRKHNLNGLQMNSDVTMRGIKVGSVTDLHISQQNIELVRVDITVSADTPVKTDTVAMINRNLLTGFAMIDLAKGTQNAASLDSVNPGGPYPVIPEGSSELEQIAETLPELFDKFGQVSGRVQAMLSEENVKAVSGIIQDVNKVTATLAKNNAKIESLLVEMEGAAKNLSSVSKSVESMTGPGGKLELASTDLAEGLKQFREISGTLNKGLSELLLSVNNSAEIVSQQMLSISQSIASGSEAVTSTLKSYEEPRLLVGGPHPRALGPGER